MLRLIAAGAVVAVILGQGLWLRDSLDSLYAARGVAPLGWADVVVVCVSNAYTLIFIVVPWLLVVGTTRLSVHADYAHMVRYGRRSRALVAHALAGVRAMSTAICVLLFAALVVAAERNVSLAWGNSASLGIPGNEALATLSTETYPIAAVIEEVAMLTLFAAVLFMAQGAVRLWSDSGVLTAVASATLWVLLIVSFKVPLPIPALVRPVNYLVAYHARIELGRVEYVMAAAIVMLMAGFAAARFVEGGARGRGFRTAME